MTTDQNKQKTSAKGTGESRRLVLRDTGRHPEPPQPPNIESRQPGDRPVEFQQQFDTAHFGSAGWAASHIVSIAPPDFLHLLAQKVLDKRDAKNTTVNGLIRVHTLAAPQFLSLFKAIAVKGLGDRIDYHAGAYVPKVVKGTKRPSLHAIGLAIDFNSAYPDNVGPKRQNGHVVVSGKPGVVRGQVGSLSELADFCADFGFFWGAWFRDDGQTNKHKWDPMHFEIARILSENELDAVCRHHGFSLDSIEQPSSGLFNSAVRRETTSQSPGTSR